MDIKNIWENCKKNFLEEYQINDSLFLKYLESAFLVKEDSKYLLVIENDLAKNILVNYKIEIKEEIEKITQEEISFVFINISIYKNKETKISSFKKTKVARQNDTSFSNFVVGKSNQEAFLACKNLVENFNSNFGLSPLVIYGDSGLGKTHLLKSIESFFYNNEDVKVLFLTSESFTKAVLDVMNKPHDDIENFKYEITSYDSLIIDDLQFLAGREKTNEILFYILDNFYENGKNIIFSSDKFPQLLNGFDNRIITRLNRGLTVPINGLDTDTASEIIKKQMNFVSMQTSVSDEAIRYISVNFGNDVRKIQGIVNKMNWWSKMNSNVSEINLETAIEIFNDHPVTSFSTLNVKKIKEVVSNRFAINIKILDSKSRKATIVSARHVAMYLIKVMLNQSFAQIGTAFGGRDHTTVMNGVRKIETLMLNDKDFKKLVENIKNDLLVK